MEVGDKILCRKTHYDENNNHIWQIGKNYKIINITNYEKEYYIETEMKNVNCVLKFNSTNFKAGLDFIFCLILKKFED